MADIQKFSWDAFSKELLCEKLTKEGAESVEKRMVDIFDACNSGKMPSVDYPRADDRFRA